MFDDVLINCGIQSCVYKQNAITLLGIADIGVYVCEGVTFQ